MSLGQKTSGTWHARIAIGKHTGFEDVGVACHHRPRAAHIVGRSWSVQDRVALEKNTRLEWHAIIVVG